MHSEFLARTIIGLATLASLTDVAIANEFENCPPAVVLSGETELQAKLRFELALRGVFTENTPAGCPVIQVRLEQHENTVSVAVIAQGRRAARDLSNSQTAALWIETWAKHDLEAPLLTARRVLPSTELNPTQPSFQTPVIRSASEYVSSRKAARSFILTPSFEVFHGNDDSRWRTLGFAACRRLGFVCVGGALRLADNLRYSGNSELSLVNRRAAELLATVGVPIPVGQATATPSVGIGLGVLNTNRAPSTDCSVDCASNPPFNIDDGFTHTSFEATFEGRLTLSFVISQWLSVDVSGTVVWRPLGRTKALWPDTIPSPDPNEGGPSGDPGPNEDGSPNNPPPPLEAYALPGEPTQVLGLGIGLRLSL